MMKKFGALILAIGAMGLSSYAAESGADTYKAKCQMCHGPAGAPSAAMAKSMNLKDLGSADVQKQSDAELKGVIEKGKGKMAGFTGKLAPVQIDELTKYVRTLKK